MMRGRSYRRGLTGIIGLLAILVLCAVAWTSFRSESDGRGGIAVGKEAPAIEGIDTSGAKVDLLDYRGQPVLVNFWASWCQPCVKEMPLIDRTYREASDRFRLISVNVGDTKGTVNEFLKAHDISFPVLIDATGRAAERYRVSALPATFAIDAEGRLSRAGIGELTEAEQLYKLLQIDK
ncbi:TlpA family protein disulfide reductase [Cohnella cellulosilytica]|uniref:TlpA family protein disulfide reductase n=1 Tax=Cohnella cellulosilytica TaxID=986710 RepID=A0ABW2FEN3_9BACL